MKLSFTGVGSAIRFWTFDSGPMWWTCLKSVGPEISFDLAFGSFIWLFRLERDFSWLPLLYTNFFFPNFTKFRLYFRVNITYPRDPRFESDQKQTFFINTFLGPESLICFGKWISFVFSDRNKNRFSISFDNKLKEPFLSIGTLFFIEIVWIHSPKINSFREFQGRCTGKCVGGGKSNLWERRKYRPKSSNKQLNKFRCRILTILSLLDRQAT